MTKVTNVNTGYRGWGKISVLMVSDGQGKLYGKKTISILKKLSEGTFGKVYLAEMITDNKFSKVVAIKVLHKNG